MSRPTILCVLLGALLAAAGGCERRGGGDETKAAAVARLETERRAVGEEMNALTASVKARLKTDDPKRVMAELDKDPAWEKLSERLRIASEALAAKRAQGAEGM